MSIIDIICTGKHSRRVIGNVTQCNILFGGGSIVRTLRTPNSPSHQCIHRQLIKPLRSRYRQARNATGQVHCYLGFTQKSFPAAKTVVPDTESTAARIPAGGMLELRYSSSGVVRGTESRELAAAWLHRLGSKERQTGISATVPSHLGKNLFVRFDTSMAVVAVLEVSVAMR